jgi:hypothetical protein
MLCVARPIAAESVREMLHQCVGLGPIAGMSQFNRALCGSYVGGFLDAASFLRDIYKFPLPFCIPPEGVSREAAIAHFIDYVTIRPDTLEATVRGVFFEALAANYPCRR